MKDPDRLTNGEDDLGASLLRSAKRYRVAEHTRERALAAVSGATTVAGPKASSKSAASPAKLAFWGLPGALVLAGGYFLVSPRPGYAPIVVHSPAASVSVARLAPTAATAVPEAPVSALIPDRPPSATLSNRPTAVSPNTAQSSAARSSSDLAGELAALDGAAKAIQAGNGAGALNLLDAYARSFPHGSLDLEAKVLRAEALESAGRHSEAVIRAKAFATRYPKSPLSVRMRRLAGE